MKPWTEQEIIINIWNLTQAYIPTVIWSVSRKVDYHAGDKWFIHGPKRRKENQLLSLKHPCWLSLV